MSPGWILRQTRGRSVPATAIQPPLPPTGCDLTATTGNAADVQNAINLATNGQVVCIPAGSWTWNQANIGITNAVTGNKYITLQGAGTMPSVGAAISGGTTISTNITGGFSAIDLQESTAGHIVICNITIEVASAANVPDFGQMNPQTAVPGGKIIIAHHMTVNYHQPTERAFRWSALRGVISRCKFTNDQIPPGGTNVGPTITCKGNSPAADNKWASVSTYGTADTNGDINLYIEDCEFDSIGSAVDLDDGCKSVVRYNTFVDSQMSDHGHDTSSVGNRQYEVYNNTFRCTYSWTNTYWYQSRGGTGVITDNIMPKDECVPFSGRPQGAYSAQLQPLRRIVYGLGTFTANTAIGSPILTNVSSTAGFAVGQTMIEAGHVHIPENTSATYTKIQSIDSATQITMTRNALANGTGISIQNADCYPGPYPWLRQQGWGWSGASTPPPPMDNQVLEPIYIWNNKWTAGGTPGEADTYAPITVTFSNEAGPCAWPTFTATLTNGSANVSSTSLPVASYYVGMHVTGTGIPAGTTIATATTGASSLTLSQAATTNGVQTLTIDNDDQTTATYVQSGREVLLSTAMPGYTKYQYPHPCAGGWAPGCT